MAALHSGNLNILGKFYYFIILLKLKCLNQLYFIKSPRNPEIVFAFSYRIHHV